MHEPKVKRVMDLLEEWEDICAEQAESTFLLAKRIHEHKDDQLSPDFLAAVSEGSDYLLKVDKQRRKMAEKILEVV